MTLQLNWRMVNESFGALLEMGPPDNWSAQERTDVIRLYDERHLLVFRGQPWTLEQQVSLVELIAPALTAGGYVSNMDGRDEVNGELFFHSDLTYSNVPLHGVSLYGELTSPENQPTYFADATAAFLRLPETLRSELIGKRARFCHVPGKYNEKMHLADLDGNSTVADHEVFLALPRTGELAIFPNQMATVCVLDTSERRSEELLEELAARLYDPQYVYAHHWQTNDLLVWDNIAIQHARGSLKGTHSPRVLRRVTFGLEETYTSLNSKYLERQTRYSAVRMR